MAYVTDAALKTYFCAQLAIAESSLETRYDTLIARSNVAAYNFIRAKLLDRGFTGDQIDNWDQREEYNLDLACCQLLRTATQFNADSDVRDQFCRSDELEDLPILVSGVLTDPTSSSGGVSYGDIEHEDDEFSQETTW